MRKVSLLSLLVSVPLLLSSCGGSGSSNGLGGGGGAAGQEFTATLPDGSPMVIEIVSTEPGDWDGEFVVGAATGPYAHQMGVFSGTAESGHLTATCTNGAGLDFALSGSVLSNGSLSLTRSDIPGTILTFSPVAAPQTKSRAEASFNFYGGSSSGRVTISTTPYANHGDFREYRGTWRSLPITFYSFDSGNGQLAIPTNDHSQAMITFFNYRISDFGTKTVNSVTAYTHAYSTVTKQFTSYGFTGTASP